MNQYGYEMVAECTDQLPCLPCFLGKGQCEMQLHLKTRLVLKYSKKEIEKIVNYNFGICPRDDRRFDELMVKERGALMFAKENFPQLYKEHSNKYY